MAQTDTVFEAPRVLVVEDDPVSATLIQKLFASQGLTVDHAEDGAVALRKHQANNYRIVVSDWMMPEMDGVTLCREFRKIPGQYVYFILCSAKHQREDRMEAYEAGVDDFLTKPLDRHEMQARLKVARRILATEDALQSQNERLELASERFEGLFNGLPVASFTFRQDGLIQEWNATAQEAFQIPAGAALGRPVWEVLEANRETWSEQRINGYFEEENPVFDWEYSIGSRKRYLACSVITIRDEAEQRKAICSNLDITERKLAEQRVEEQMLQINHYAAQLNEQKLELERINNRLNHLAITDGLTGLWNHRKFQELLEHSVDEFARTLQPFSLVLLDIDNFKRVNDELGHQVGDDVLKQFAEVLRQQSRSYELPARYGGEEFAVILSCAEDEAIRAAERFRIAIEQHPWKHWQMTASFGVSTCTMPGTTAKMMIRHADDALYTAKQAGRNRCMHYRSLTGNEGTALAKLS